MGERLCSCQLQEVLFFFLRVCPPSRSWGAAARLLSTWHLRCNADVHVYKIQKDQGGGADGAEEEQAEEAPEGRGAGVWMCILWPSCVQRDRPNRLSYPSSVPEACTYLAEIARDPGKMQIQ